MNSFAIADDDIIEQFKVLKEQIDIDSAKTDALLREARAAVAKIKVATENRCKQLL